MSKESTDKILRDFGCTAPTAEQREAAEYLAYKAEQIRKGEIKND